MQQTPQPLFSDEAIETKARTMCLAAGLNPDELITAGDGDGDRIAERSQRTSVFGYQTQIPRWRVWRYQAEISLISSL